MLKLVKLRSNIFKTVFGAKSMKHCLKTFGQFWLFWVYHFYSTYFWPWFLFPVNNWFRRSSPTIWVVNCSFPFFNLFQADETRFVNSFECFFARKFLLTQWVKQFSSFKKLFLSRNWSKLQGWVEVFIIVWQNFPVAVCVDRFIRESFEKRNLMHYERIKL